MNQLSIASQSIQPRPIGMVVAIAGIATVGFAVLAYFVAKNSTVGFDDAVLLWINQTTTPFLDTFFVALTELGGLVVLTAFSLLLAGYFAVKKHYLKVALIVAGMGGAALLNILLKSIFDRPRPDLWEWLVVETHFSFPSGHATASMALALIVVALAWKTRFRVWALVGAALYVLSIAYSRLYLGVHYPTDILGGWLTSIAWVSVVIVVLYRYRTKKVTP